MSGVNYYERLPKKDRAAEKKYRNYDKVRISVPNRFIIAGSSGSGKTNSLLNILVSMNAWSRYYLFVKCPDEPLYKLLVSLLEKAEKKTKQEMVVVSTTLEDMPDVDDIDERYPTVMVFDDMLLNDKKDQAAMTEYFIRGRKKNVSVFYLTQSYFGVPKAIRQSTDVVVFKKLTQKDLSLVLTEFAAEKTKEELLALYKRSGAAGDVTKFLLIDSSPGQAAKWKYRANFEPLE
jgi:replication-associated recombination protein RarA